MDQKGHHGDGTPSLSPQKVNIFGGGLYRVVQMNRITEALILKTPEIRFPHILTLKHMLTKTYLIVYSIGSLLILIKHFIRKRISGSGDPVHLDPMYILYTFLGGKLITRISERQKCFPDADSGNTNFSAFLEEYPS